MKLYLVLVALVVVIACSQTSTQAQAPSLLQIKAPAVALVKSFLKVFGNVVHLILGTKGLLVIPPTDLTSANNVWNAVQAAKKAGQTVLIVTVPPPVVTPLSF